MGMGREEARKKPETGVHVWVGWLVGWLVTDDEQTTDKEEETEEETMKWWRRIGWSLLPLFTSFVVSWLVYVVLWFNLFWFDLILLFRYMLVYWVGFVVNCRRSGLGLGFFESLCPSVSIVCIRMVRVCARIREFEWMTFATVITIATEQRQQ